tara:strand:- start:172 stop:363 length:192 start_codon:yes stop_codon:yes gene_type:complete
MKIGDAVRFIGFKNYPVVPTIGIIIKSYWENQYGETRYDVLWSDETIGQGLYLDTLEVISESR